MRNYAGSALMLLFTLAAALGSYTVNLQVSAERAAVDGLRRQLVADAREVRNLQVELRTRARLPEMQRWNDNVLLMAAPQATQYLHSSVQLASFAAPPAEAAPPSVRFAVAGSGAPAPVAADTGRVVRVDAPAARPGPAAPRIIRAAYQPAPAPALAEDDGVAAAVPGQ